MLAMLFVKNCVKRRKFVKKANLVPIQSLVTSGVINIVIDEVIDIMTSKVIQGQGGIREEVIHDCSQLTPQSV